MHRPTSRSSLRTRIRCLAALALSALALAACGGDDDGSSASQGGGIPDGPIVIGNAIAQSGQLAPYDSGPAEALKVAVADINANGGVKGHKLELIYSDTTSDPAKGTAAALDVIEKGAKVVVVTCDFDMGAPAAQAAVSKGILAISTCGGSDRFNPEVLGPLVFSMGTRAFAEGEVMAKWGYEEKGWRSVYLLRDSTLAYAQDMCRGMEESFPEQSGAEIAGKSTFKEGDARVTAQISDIRATNPDFIWLCSGTPGGAPVLKQLRAAGIDTPVAGGSAYDGDYWLGGVPNLSEFYYATYGSIYGDDPRPEINRLFEKEKAATGKRAATSFDVTGYALGEAVKIAIERANSLDGMALSEALESFKDEPLLVGPTTFTAERHIAAFRPLAIFEVSNGKPQLLEIYPKG
jgi:branched-chain amino acid transport system substrate-binding protein